MPKNDLKELAAIAQIFGAISGPQQQGAEMRERGEDRRMQLALQMLGLQQQQEGAVADRALRAREVGGREMETKSRAAQAFGDPGLSAVGRKALGTVHPELGQVENQVRSEENTAMAAKMAPALQAVYDSNKNSPEKIRPTIDSMNISPEVLKLFPWDKLNAGLAPTPGQSTPATGARGIGETIRKAPGRVPGAMQAMDESLGNAGMNFWAGMFGLDPNQQRAPDGALTPQQLQTIGNDPMSKLFKALGL
jgi:hypothetical protein